MKKPRSAGVFLCPQSARGLSSTAPPSIFFSAQHLARIFRVLDRCPPVADTVSSISTSGDVAVIIGSLEEAATESIAAGAEQKVRHQAWLLEKEGQLSELRDALSKYLGKVQRRNYRSEKTYQTATAPARAYFHRGGGGGGQNFNLTDVEGWVVESRHPKEWDTCDPKGTLATASGELYGFTAESVYAPN